MKTKSNSDIAIIGMSGRFPGAENIALFWDIIKEGKEEIIFYSREELLERGVDPGLLNNPGYVFADSIIESADKFDSSFFGYTPREADFMDPQHRIFLEECFSALENAGYDPERYDGEIGVFAGCSLNRYLIKNLLQHNDILKSLGELQTIINNDKDFLTTRISYKLNLKGPSVDIQTACSTSLVAIHFACQSLITNQCDMALSGGVYIKVPRGEGYIFEEGSIDSPTGHCHPFDKNANGTIFGEGAGVVVLKRLEDAIHDRDTIIAVIKATAINNDGSLKVGYMAPGITGQAKVISKAFDIAGIDTDTVSYLETHGTGTKMGDPIEIEALKRIFSNESKRNYCALGSVKANIGHLDVAAGVAGLIKSALVLKNRQIPPLVNFTTPNPELDLENSPFYINTGLKNWDTNGMPRRAAVSSFGIGGTNCHAVLEEWNQKIPESSPKRFHLLPISAKTEGALHRMYDNLISHLSQTTNNIADIAYTLQNGRKEFKNRGMLIWDNSDDKKPVFSEFPYFKGSQKLSDPRTIFMFTGQGSQYFNMARGLYENFDSVKTIMDYADTLLNANHNLNLLEIIFNDSEENKEKINETFIAQPALFVVQYAVAHLLMEFGILPDAMTGHSIGEITAACLSGVFSFEDALNIVAWRGKLMQAQAPGSMLSINLSKDKVLRLIDDNVELALNNAPDFCVVSGSYDAIDLFWKKISVEYPQSRVSRLKTSHAFHSRLMEPALKPFLQVLQDTKFGSIRIPFISNVTGTWITNEAATSPEYWASHIRSMVNFTDGINELLKDENEIFIEVGPGNTLSTLLSQFRTETHLTCLLTLRHPRQSSNDIEFLFKSVSCFWLNGGIIRWDYIYCDEERYRVPLPSYPFERIKHWVDPKIPLNFHTSSREAQIKKDHVQISESGSTENGSGASELLHIRPELENEFIPANSAIEKRIAAIWEELLGIKEIGVTDNFFFIGGHSLLASQIINRINEEFNARITFENFFNLSTIRGLAGSITVKQEYKEPAPVKARTDYSLPQTLSPAQERLWIVSQIENNNPSYILSFSYVFEGDLDKEIFKESLEVLFERHKILKSYIRIVNGTPSVIINNGFNIYISELDFSGLSAIDQDKRVQDFIKNENRTRFSVGDNILYRVTLLNLGKKRTLFNFTIHHLIFDGWSWGVFTKELKEIYNKLLGGEKPNLEPLSIDYFEFAKSAREEKETVSLEEYWRNKLKGITGQLNFPFDFKRPEISTGEGGRVALEIGNELTEKIRKYSKKENVTLYMLFLSVFGFLLSRYSGDKDICLGSPTANRPNSKLEKLIGLFINSIVLRLQIDEQMNFSTFLNKVKNDTIEALSNQGLPFERLVDILQPERILNVNPVFQVMFAWQNAPRPPLELTGIKSSRVFQENGVSPLDITLYAWEEEVNIVGELEFSTDIFKRSTIESLRENFIELLDNIVSNPQIPLKNISILSGHERKRLAEFNKTDAKVPEVPLQALFEETVKKFSDKSAIEVISSGVRITYSELQKRSNQLAHFLQKKGFRKGSTAGISMDRTESMIIAVMAVLKCGGAYLPLDPAFPDDRLFYMLEDSGATALITEQKYSNRFKIPKTIKIVLDTERSNISGESTLDISHKIDVNTIAYIIYTSGSSGKPKGVKVHHRAVVNLINSMSKVPGLSPEDRLLAVTTLSFDISVLELFLPLSFGATVFIADNEHVRDGESLARIIEEYHISIMQATPATWTILLASGWKGEKELKALCGGEALQPGLARDLIGKVKSLWNMYGPTETTVWSSCELVTDHNNILVGKPIDNTRFHILNDNQERPVGAIGELCIGGMGVSKGYHKREELNREKFIKWNDQILYRTGDLARFNDNGKIELLGRTDYQIKFHGFRIEPGEIEFQLSQIKGVKEAVVKLEKNGESDERLTGYLNVSDSFNFNRDQIVESVGNLLPGYMVPSSFLIMKEFPRTLNGKIDRKALAFNINNIPEEGKEETKELTEFEKSLAKIWQEILKTRNIKTNQSFFDMGGNSLMAIQVLTRIKEELNLNISFKTFLQNPSISKLSAQLTGNGQMPERTIELIHLKQKTNLPLTLNQKRLWLISKLNPDIPSYIIQYTCRLQGPLDTGIFQKSLELLFHRHHIVFSVIREEDSEPYCEIIPNDVNISFIDYSWLPENEKEIKINDIVNADSRQVFDLKNGPMYRLYLIMTNVNEFYFHISIHHIVFDGWSWTVFVKDLHRIYNSLLNGKETGLENIEFQQYDYAHWENNFAGFNKRNELIEFWRNNLKGATPILNFPYDFQRRDKPSGRGKHVPIHLSQELTEKIRRISKNEDSSLFTTMLSVFGIQMHKYSGQDDINIGLPVAYRPYSRLENIFGMFVNTVVVRLKFEKNLTFKDAIRRTNEATLNAIAHQELPFETIVDLVNPERASNVNPLFQVGFVWQNNLNMPLQLDRIRSERITCSERTTPFDIIMYLWEDGESIQGEIEYSTDLLKHETILRLKNNFLSLINNLLVNSETTLETLSIISDEDKKLIENINSTITPYPKDKTIVQLFEDQVALYPDKMAVVFNKEFFTYKQLNEKVNQLARTLRRSGIGSDVPVGILVEKSLDLIIGILGILKAGGGYVPIEPEYPEHRINFMLKDSGCKVLLTQDKFINMQFEGVAKLNLNSNESYQSDASNVQRINDSSSLAYIMYTSGTTGKPKGSLIQQYSVVRLVRNTNYIELTAADRILLTGAIGFDATTFEIWGALLNGGTLYLVDKETIINPKALGEELNKNDITVLWLTSPLFTMIAESQPDIFKKLKYLFSGGDVLSASHINKVRNRNPHLKIINAYGPTENTTFSTTYLIERDFERNIPIGKPVGNSTAYIFDSNMNYQPVGVIGELFVGGDGLSKGYLNHEDLNKKCFLDHPYIKGEKIYRTGDFARWLVDGNIEFHGRVDNQLKVRGFRVETGEIESVISEMDGIIDAVIKPIKIKEGDVRLAAFLNVSDAFNMDTRELSKRIKEKLPPQMVPSMFKIMHGFPKTVNGKIDRDALTVDMNKIGFEKPGENGQMTPTEKTVHEIWCKVLNIKDISKTDNFFEIGGSSLLAATVLSKLESLFKVNLRLKTFFNNPRLKDLAEFIDDSHLQSN